MEIIIDRYRKTEQYTLSRLYERGARHHFVIDLVEPPLLQEPTTGRKKERPGIRCGKTEEGPQALPPGFYKLFLRPDKENFDLACIFQRVKRGRRLGFESVAPEGLILESGVDFSTESTVYKIPLFCGSLTADGKRIEPDRDLYNRFMMRMIFAKQNHEIVIANLRK